MARKYKRKSTIGSIEVRGKNSCRVKWTDEYKRRHSETIQGTYEDADLYLLKIQQSSRRDINGITFGNYWEC